MDDVNVLVLFYSRGGDTERLAVLLAEGAVQAGARIRLRRARDLAPEDTIARDPDWLAARDRMHQEFAAPQPADAAWADVLCCGTPAAPAQLSPELALVLHRWRSEVPLPGKLATAFTSSYGTRAGSEFARAALESTLLRSGLILVPTEAVLSPTPASDEFEQARSHGRYLVHLARALKAASPGFPQSSAP